MSTATARTYQPYFAGRFMPSRIRKSPEIKPFHWCRSTFTGKAHGSGGFMARAKNNSEVIWSEQRSV